jgi:hypothetical protein
VTGLGLEIFQSVRSSLHPLDAQCRLPSQAKALPSLLSPSIQNSPNAQSHRGISHSASNSVAACSIGNSPTVMYTSTVTAIQSSAHQAKGFQAADIRMGAAQLSGDAGRVLIGQDGALRGGDI